MSGHSKWAQIKHKKAATDAKKSVNFSKLTALITVAAREKGGDANTNPKLRMAIEKAKSFNMPADNIERAIKKGTGELEGIVIEELFIEAYGPNGKPILITAVTDSKNRTISEIKHILSKYEGKMAGSGSVQWMFEEKGQIILNNQKIDDDLELKLIEIGAEEIKEGDEEIEIITKPNDLEKMKEEITAEDIAEVVARWTGIPLTKMMEEERAKLEKMEVELNKRVIGQDTAIKRVADVIRRSRAGIGDPNRPIGSFIFLGPTGVGKTELTKALGQFMFNDDKAIIRVDMSEYMERHSMSKLIGSPPGYVGYDEAGQLTETVRHRPYSVILFDEIEKAHPEIFNILLQVIDEGRLTDGKGRVVNFKNTIIILTSNIGSQFVEKMESIGFSNNEKLQDYTNMKEKVMEALKDNFRPEFLNRLDEIIVFDILSEEALKEIVKLRIKTVRERLFGKGIEFEISEEALSYLAKTGYDPHYGARPLNRLIQNKILNPIASHIISSNFKNGDSVYVSVKGDELVIETKKGHTKSPFRVKSKSSV